MTNFKRKKLNFKIKTQFQKWLLFRIFGSVLLSSLVAACILYLYSRQEIGASFYSAHLNIKRVSDLLLPVILAGSFVSLVSGTIVALFLPQKIAGPIYRLEKNLLALKEGDLKATVSLRDNDNEILKEFAETMNTTISSFRTRIHSLKDTQTELARSLAQQEGQDLARLLEAQQKQLDYFQT